MKPFFAAVALLLTLPLLSQAVPTTINYQGRLTDNTPAQTPVSATVPMAFAIYDTASGGASLWMEPASGGTNVTVSGGIFNVLLGSTVALPPALFTGATSTRYLEITVNPGPSQEILAPRQLITATGYAQLAANANRAVNATTAGSAGDSAGLGGLPATAYQKTLAIPACPLNQFFSAVNPDGTSACAAPTGFAGSLAGDVTGPQSATVVALVGGSSAAIVSTGAGLANAASSANTPNAIVRRDGAGRFFAGVITASLNGNATTATDFTGALAGDVTGPQSATLVAAVGGKSAAALATSVNDTQAATPLNTPSTIVRRDASGDFAAGSITASLNGNATSATTATTLSRDGFSLSTLSGGPTLTPYSEIAIGIDGLGLISYYDDVNDDLKVLHCSDGPCTTATTATLASTNLVGAYNSITIGTDGLGLISYYDATNFNLRVAHCSNAQCTAAALYVLDSAGGVGEHTSITIGTDRMGLISYYDGTNGDLKVAHCSNLSCSAATTATLDGIGDIGKFTAITIGSDGLGLISYFDSTNGNLKVAHCLNLLCTAATASTLDSTGVVGNGSSITIGTDGLGLISYWDQDNSSLKIAHCSNLDCSIAATGTLDNTASVGGSNSITLSSDGLGLISYKDSTNSALKVAHCSNVVCSSAVIATLDNATMVANNTSITLGADGLGLISYTDATTGINKVAHCSNILCTPYVRRR